jgi:XTP/dITP diphosphohydrolase
MKIIIASHNPHKIKEFKEILPDSVSALSLKDLKIDQEIEETGSTLEENARIKAETISRKFQLFCIADDTGLEISALNGRPGVFSARYAGEPSDPLANMEKVLKEMEGIFKREAQFRTILAYYDLEKIQFFEGVVEGKILTEPRGNGGFGYDPIFLPRGKSKTFAEMNAEEKNRISHRGRALELFQKIFNAS